MTGTHLMIVHPRYLGPILTGHKTTEARLGRDRRAPYDHVQPGDTVYIKPTSLEVAAHAIVERVDQYEDLEAIDIEKLHELYEDRVLGGDDFWLSKADARYATFVTLGRVRPMLDSKSVPAELLIASRNAWRVLDRGAARRAA